MTERKGLKKLVRARMASTSESYSTAHHHITARRATRPADSHGHRESSLVRSLLAARGLDLSEPMVCGLGGGIGFLYAVFEYASVPHPLLTLVAQHHPQPWAPAVLERLGVPFAQTHSTTAAAAMTKLRNELSGGPVLCTVDRSGLPWHQDVSPLAAADPFVVVITEGDRATLVVEDGHNPARAMDADAFGRAWSGHRKGRHRMLTVGAVPSRVDLDRAVADALSTTVAHMTGPVLGNAFDVNMGLSGMAKLVAELRDRRTKVGWRRRFATPTAFEHAMGRLDACLQREYTAPDATRPIFAEYLDEVGQRGAATLIRESGAGWREVAARARPATMDQSGLFDELADLVESNLDIERRAMALLAPAGPSSQGRE